MKLFVGNISWSVKEDQLAELFSNYGDIEECKIIHDRATGRSRGFGFVTMVNDEEGQNAMEALNGQEFDGRPLNVNVARPKTDRPGVH